MKTITVHNASQTYLHLDGRPLGQCGSGLKQQTKAQTAAVIIDDHSGQILRRHRRVLEASGFPHAEVCLSHGEASKRSRTLNQIYARLSLREYHPDGTLPGSPGRRRGGRHITGFAAAPILRGLTISRYSTSLLAQVDFFRGGKTATNLPRRQQNPVGAFAAAGGGAV